jgi:hypothetical protein
MNQRIAQGKAPRRTDYVFGTEACEIIACSPRHLARAVELGMISVWALPGARKRYRRVDCENLRDQAFRPATAARVLATL